MLQLNVLLSSAGRRVERIGCFRESLKDLGIDGRVLAADCSFLAPAMHLADKAHIVPRCHDYSFIPAMLDLARSENIHLIVPNLDDELPILAAARGEFQAQGTYVAVSSEEVVQIAGDKALTHSWLEANRFPTVRQAAPAEVLADPTRWEFPLIAKPRCGSGSVGVRLISCAAELQWMTKTTSGFIVQERACGTEYTVNVYVNRQGACVCAVPHARIEVRAGEVSKGVTAKHHGMMTLATAIAEALPGARGPLNIQCFLSGEDIRIIEINPRFGGGYPLAHRAGASFTRWMIQELVGIPVNGPVDDWQDHFTMIRYNEALFLPSSAPPETS